MPNLPAVVQDTREQKPWAFKNVIIKKLETGDYSLIGFEETHCVDRKGIITELAHNLTEKRFERECMRMKSMDRAIIIAEFEKRALSDWPENAGLTQDQKSKVKTSAKFLRKRLYYLQETYGIIFIFAGPYGREACIEEFRQWIRI